MFTGVTFTFVNGTKADGTQVNTNFDDVINGLSDGSKDLNVYDITCNSLTCSSLISPSTSTLDTYTIAGSAPQLTFQDTDCTDADDNAYINASATDTGSGTEDIDVTMYQQIAGAATAFLTSDADGDITLGDGTRDIVLDGGNVEIGDGSANDELIFKIPTNGECFIRSDSPQYDNYIKLQDYQGEGDEAGVEINAHTNLDFESADRIKLTTTDVIISSDAPVVYLRDSSCTDSDNNATILVAATDTGSGTEDIDVTFKQQVAGTDTAFLTADADGNLTFGDGSRTVKIDSTDIELGDGATLSNGTDIITFEGDSGLGLGPQFQLYHTSASPAAADTVGRLDFIGRNDAAEAQVYGRIESDIVAVTDGSEDGIITFWTADAGATSERARITSHGLESEAQCVRSSLLDGWSANQKTAFGIVDDDHVSRLFFEDASYGGLQWAIYSEDSAGNGVGVNLIAYTENDLTTHGSFIVDGRKHDGAGGLTTVGDTHILFNVKNNNSTRFRIMGDGDTEIHGAAPTLKFLDSGCTDSDDNAYITVNATDTGSGTEDVDVTLYQQIAGTATAFLTSDADGDITIGDGSRDTVIDGSNVEISGSAPTLKFLDSDCTDADDNAYITVAATDTGSGTEDIDVTFYQQIAGSATAFITADADGDITIGDGSRDTVIDGSNVEISGSAPTLKFLDSDCTDADDNAYITAAATDTGSGTEDIDVTFYQQIAGTATAFLSSDADGSLDIGDDTRTVKVNTFAEFTSGKILELDQGANDDRCFRLASSDVSHGVTTVLETDQYMGMGKRDTTFGGVAIVGICEDTDSGVAIQGIKTTTSTQNGAVLIEGYLKDGTGTQALASTAAVIEFRNAGTKIGHVEGDGKIYVGVGDGSPVAYSSTTTGGSGSAGAGNQYVELNIGGTVYKVLHDGTV